MGEEPSSLIIKMALTQTEEVYSLRGKGPENLLTIPYICPLLSASP